MQAVLCYNTQIYSNLMQYKIPQNVQIEDKIVGPLTLKQLIILGVGGGITYAIYTYLASRYSIGIWIWFVVPPGMLTAAFAFLKINGIPFAKWIILTAEHFYNPRKRTFLMGAGDDYKTKLFTEKKVEQKDDTEKIKAAETAEKRKHLAEITKLVDSYEVPHQPKTTP